MHRLLVLYPPPTDPDHFRSYYEDTHLKLVAKLPGLRGYRYGFDVASRRGESQYFCVFEADFDDAAALSAALGSAEGQAGSAEGQAGSAEGQAGSAEGQAVLADVPNYATGGVVSLNYEIRTG